MVTFMTTSVLPFSSYSSFLSERPVAGPRTNGFLANTVRIRGCVGKLCVALPSFDGFNLKIHDRRGGDSGVVTRGCSTHLRKRGGRFDKTSS